jgi:hypothetical protein
LTFADHSPFATGATRYACDDRYENGGTPKVIAEVVVAGQFTDTILDTGAPYLLCSPSLAASLQIDPNLALSTASIRVRGYLIQGGIHRLELKIPAENGMDLVIDATAFVPFPGQLVETLPSFLGWQGCLERMRFALDPVTETFYFGDCAA